MNTEDADQILIDDKHILYCNGEACVAVQTLAVFAPSDVVRACTPSPIADRFLCQECYLQPGLNWSKKCELLQEFLPAVLATIILEYAHPAGVEILTMKKIIPGTTVSTENVEHTKETYQEYILRCAKVALTYSTSKFEWLTFMRTEYSHESLDQIKWSININVDSKFFGHVMSFELQDGDTVTRYCGHFLDFYDRLVSNSMFS